MFPLLFAFPSHTLFIICLFTHEEKMLTHKATEGPVIPEEREFSATQSPGDTSLCSASRVCFHKDTSFLNRNLNECIQFWKIVSSTALYLKHFQN